MRNRALCAIYLPGYGGRDTGAIYADEVGVFGIGTDSAMYYKLWDGNVWLPSQTGWFQLGNGLFNSIPAATIRGNELQPVTADVFGLGLDNQAWTMRLQPGYQPPWPPIPGDWRPIGGVFNGPLDTRAYGSEGGAPGNLSVAVVGLIDNQPSLQGVGLGGLNAPPAQAQLTGWLPLGGSLIFEPVIAYRGDTLQTQNAFDLFGVGLDAQMFHMEVQFANASQWPPKLTGWQPAGGCFISAPTVVKWNDNRIDVFGITPDNQLLHRAMENGVWIEDWENLGGKFDSPVAAASWANNRLDLFGLGTDDQMYHKWWAGGPWKPSPLDWDGIGGPLGGFASAPAVVATGTERLDIFGIGTDTHMYHKAWRGGPDWSPPQLQWDLIGGNFKFPPPTQQPAQLDFDQQFTFPGDVALGGRAHVTLRKDGTCTFSGHFHDSGAIGYTFSVVCIVTDSKGRSYGFSDGGDVSGTLSLGGSRDFDWNLNGANADIATHWGDFFGCGGASSKFGAKEGVDVVSLIFGLGFPPNSVIKVIGKW
jgi:Repeat of unknown function (DUF346)